MSECSGIIAACKTSVSEYYASENGLPADSDAAGCATTETQYCGAPSVAAGVITVEANTDTGLPGACNLVMTPAADVTSWEGSTTCDSKYVAATFR
ncbi:pilin [Gilvimarinus sp. 2_MG-2023]|uniref:pilin n=1 Tax=Gilvimarinus sp. 2_MG-2023 TaxID=3062666 RepID=UPI0026E2F2AF|nr:pilin [Gilvimarinus sp. 2_MG-2023]MDO6570317.1 pilin [Gilvimarinus sp. 2_MG-2023]